MPQRKEASSDIARIAHADHRHCIRWSLPLLASFEKGKMWIMVYAQFCSMQERKYLTKGGSNTHPHKRLASAQAQNALNATRSHLGKPSTAQTFIWCATALPSSDKSASSYLCRGLRRNTLPTARVRRRRRDLFAGSSSVGGVGGFSTTSAVLKRSAEMKPWASTPTIVLRVSNSTSGKACRGASNPEVMARRSVK